MMGNASQLSEGHCCLLVLDGCTCSPLPAGERSTFPIFSLITLSSVTWLEHDDRRH
jgi:hypothetical protein